jgi:hypothetical protein
MFYISTLFFWVHNSGKGHPQTQKKRSTFVLRFYQVILMGLEPMTP